SDPTQVLEQVGEGTHMVRPGDELPVPDRGKQMRDRVHRSQCEETERPHRAGVFGHINRKDLKADALATCTGGEAIQLRTHRFGPAHHGAYGAFVDHHPQRGGAVPSSRTVPGLSLYSTKSSRIGLGLELRRDGTGVELTQGACREVEFVRRRTRNQVSVE